MAVRAWCSAVKGSPSFSAKSRPTSAADMWMAGVTMWIGRWPANCTMYSPRSVSTARMPAAESTSLSSISSVTIDFDLTTLLTPCWRAMSRT